LISVYRGDSVARVRRFLVLAVRSHDNGNGSGDHRKVVPNGRYVLRFTALKALGDVSTPGHTETWTSPVITLAR
jgi:hypothetical protein